MSYRLFYAKYQRATSFASWFFKLAILLAWHHHLLFLTIYLLHLSKVLCIPTRLRVFTVSPWQSKVLVGSTVRSVQIAWLWLTLHQWLISAVQWRVELTIWQLLSPMWPKGRQQITFGTLGMGRLRQRRTLFTYTLNREFTLFRWQQRDLAVQTLRFAMTVLLSCTLYLSRNSRQGIPKVITL